MYALALWSLVTTLSFFSTNVFAFRFFAGQGGHTNHTAAHELLKRAQSHIKRDGDDEISQLLKRQNLNIFSSLSDLLLEGSSGGIPDLPLGGGGFVGPEWNGEIDLWGKQRFQPPGPNDQRGPCIGLNAMANHNIIDHSGIVGLFEVVAGANKVLGLGADISLLVALMGLLWGGNPVDLKFSIGGPDSRVQAPLGGALGLLGAPQGLDFTHNFVETDSSLTRRDLYETGNCWSLDIDLFSDLYYSVPFGQSFTFEHRAAWASHRFYQSIATNPEFYAGPYTLFLGRNTAWLLGVRLLSDWSTGSPILTHDMLLTWYGVTDTGNGLVANHGWERIPPNWKRIPHDYSAIPLNLDLVQWAVWYPELASVGGNTGTVNSFAGLNLGDPSSGIDNLPNLLLGNRLICFALEIIKTGSPTYTNNLFTSLFKLFGTTVESLGCPQVGGLTVGGVPIGDWAQQNFPGARRGSWM